MLDSGCSGSEGEGGSGDVVGYTGIDEEGGGICDSGSRGLVGEGGSDEADTVVVSGVKGSTMDVG